MLCQGGGSRILYISLNTLLPTLKLEDFVFHFIFRWSVRWVWKGNPIGFFHVSTTLEILQGVLAIILQFEGGVRWKLELGAERSCSGRKQPRRCDSERRFLLPCEEQVAAFTELIDWKQDFLLLLAAQTLTLLHSNESRNESSTGS